ncbi:MAG TPA: hypothetical protein VI861_02165, partial [Rickettsiales bacterium]|nr:hypothetical protein [Rickettsiales bacterium]
ENRVVFVEGGRITILLTDLVKVALTKLLIGTKCAIWSANENGKVTTFRPSFWTDCITLPAFDCQIASFKIKEEGGFWIERPKQRGFSDTGFSKDATFDTSGFF